MGGCVRRSRLLPPADYLGKKAWAVKAGYVPWVLVDIRIGLAICCSYLADRASVELPDGGPVSTGSHVAKRRGR
jgi:hypothetical protein